MTTIEQLSYNAYFEQQYTGWLNDEDLSDIRYGIQVRRDAYQKGASEVANLIAKKAAEVLSGECTDTESVLTIINFINSLEPCQKKNSEH